jgi:hypothetical protein
MKEPEGGREEVRDHYEGHDIDMSIACAPDCQLESGAKDSPAMTGESKEEVDYNNFRGGKSNAGEVAP